MAASTCRAPRRFLAPLVSPAAVPPVRERAAPGRWVAQGRAEFSLGSKPVRQTPVDGRPEGERSLPLVEGCKGRGKALCSMGPGRGKSPGAMQRRTLLSAGWGSMPHNVSGRLTQSLGENVPKGRLSLGIALGGPRGMRNPPGKVGAVLPAHTLYNLLLAGDAPILSIGREF